MKKFIRGIRQSDRPTRRRWFVIFSITAGLLVVVVWLFQFSITFSGLFPQGGSVVGVNETPSMWSKFSAAVSTSFNQIKDTTSDAYEGLKTQINKTNELEIASNPEEKTIEQ